MPTHRIAVIAGDGIGPEVIEPAISVAETAVFQSGEGLLEWHRMDWGCDYYLRTGRMMPADGLETLREFDAILLGAVGRPDVPDHVTLRGLLLPIRRTFDQFINIRPATLFEGIISPLRGRPPGTIDLVVLRENTEGEYCDVGGRAHVGTYQEVAIQTSVFTRHATERIIRAAFELAKRRRRHVTSITKSNAQGFSMVFWDEVFSAVSTDYPEIATRSLLIDTAVMELVRRPESFDVVVASNLFGDILTDLSATISGSLGLAASGNVNPNRQFPSMFEPVHGSAPDIAGQRIANPLGAILSAKMMLEHLGHKQAAKLIDAAVRGVLRRREVLPPDLGGKANTADVTSAVIQAVARPN